MKKPYITEEKWFEYSNKWMVNLINLYGDRSVTTYVHTFVYHLGFYLAKYGPLLAFANFSIESSHKVTKQNRVFATNNGISKKKEGANENSFTTQLLAKFLRLSIIKRSHDREKWQEIDRDGTNWGNWDESTRKNNCLKNLFKIDNRPNTTKEDQSKKNYLEASSAQFVDDEGHVDPLVPNPDDDDQTPINKASSHFETSWTNASTITPSTYSITLNKSTSPNTINLSLDKTTMDCSYSITLNDKGMECDCKSYCYNQYARCCKHTIAVLVIIGLDKIRIKQLIDNVIKSKPIDIDLAISLQRLKDHIATAPQLPTNDDDDADQGPLYDYGGGDSCPSPISPSSDTTFIVSTHTPKPDNVHNDQQLQQRQHPQQHQKMDVMTDNITAEATTTAAAAH
ncbi:hypothetical protein SAMD00019534_126400 [Acytostelium subglobosum LB1]|uniref:hypothetical protein n=1 Tax=Acytostelium subglobosum LB1 TaxID=1410327 RepID=UPI000644D771|nr:hypothetical protein SAMD00019534_126400 [Acytostelium subglobosum LB1]GAM29464.1 hypothetical protein SAMD00019534_126400 [Acytostelium subglobosum LB1]|eukprot:XP_012747591.1 hypothetical protein SAMD00019534_126400 [Acytostelium subglobosum LB1]